MNNSIKTIRSRHKSSGERLLRLEDRTDAVDHKLSDNHKIAEYKRDESKSCLMTQLKKSKLHAKKNDQKYFKIHKSDRKFFKPMKRNKCPGI